jgi:tetratricopeptide (TPR) repeat protein
MKEKIFLAPLAATLLAACLTKPASLPPPVLLEAPAPPAPPIPLEEKLAEAESLLNKGGYVHLRGAYGLYRELEAAGADRDRFAGPYARATLLVAARAKEMGIRNDSYLAKARELVENDPKPAFLVPAMGITAAMPVATMGVWDDDPGRPEAPETASYLELMGTDLMTGAPTEPLQAYFRALLLEASGRADEARAGLDESLTAFPGSLLLRFKRAALPPPDARLLEEILEQEPEFAEAFLERARLALAGGALITAEIDFLQARESVPESPFIAILLAGVNFGTEEYDRSLDFYDETLDIAPSYKEALFGKAVCLSCLGRPVEAVPLFEELLARGPALKGECLYWLAAGLYDLGDAGRAAAEIEKAKRALPVGRVYTLAGKIAFEDGRPGDAEADLITAVNMDSGETDAFFLLGKLYALRKNWPESALNFELAGHGYGFKEDQIREKIAQIESSSMSEDRKDRLLARKRFQLEKTRLTRATACFNAAAGHHNAGVPEKALFWARSAAAHPHFADKVKDLLALVTAGK